MRTLKPVQVPGLEDQPRAKPKEAYVTAGRPLTVDEIIQQEMDDLEKCWLRCKE